MTNESKLTLVHDEEPKDLDFDPDLGHENNRIIHEFLVEASENEAALQFSAYLLFRDSVEFLTEQGWEPTDLMKDLLASIENITKAEDWDTHATTLDDLARGGSHLTLVETIKDDE
jgi:hypothetical protein